MSATRRLLVFCGVSAPLVEDFIDQYENFGTGRLWRRAVLDWLGRQANTVLALAGVAALFRLGTLAPVWGLNAGSVEALRRAAGPASVSVWDIVAGANLSRVSLFALGILPLIKASCLVQIYTVGWRRPTSPPMRHEALATSILAVVLGVGTSFALARYLEASGQTPGFSVLVAYPGWPFRLTTVATLTTSMTVLMCLGDWLTTRGLANGILLVWIAGIVAGLPDQVGGFRGPSAGQYVTLALSVVFVAAIARRYRRALLCSSVPTTPLLVPQGDERIDVRRTA